MYPTHVEQGGTYPRLALPVACTKSQKIESVTCDLSKSQHSDGAEQVLIPTKPTSPAIEALIAFSNRVGPPSPIELETYRRAFPNTVERIAHEAVKRPGGK